MKQMAYGDEKTDTKLLLLRLLGRTKLIAGIALLGAVLVGGPYFLTKVVYGPAKEYQAVSDFYIDYAKQETGEEYTYFNQTTWTQLFADDVFTDAMLEDLARQSGQGVEAASGITKEMLLGEVYATLLSDNRIVTTTVTTNDPARTLAINDALVYALEQFGKNQKEIGDVRILQKPEQASQVIADVRVLRAVMMGLILFGVTTFFGVLLYEVTDDSIHVPATFEKRYGIPMIGATCAKDFVECYEQMLLKKSGTGAAADAKKDREAVLYPVEPILVVLPADEQTPAALLRQELEKTDLLPHPIIPDAERCVDILSSELTQEKKEVLLAVRAGAHNGRAIERTLSLCEKYGVTVKAAVLIGADERLLWAYELPGHAFGLHRRKSLRKK